MDTKFNCKIIYMEATKFNYHLMGPIGGVETRSCLANVQQPPSDLADIKISEKHD